MTIEHNVEGHKHIYKQQRITTGFSLRNVVSKRSATTFDVRFGAVINSTKEISGFKVRYAKVSPLKFRHGSKTLGQQFLLDHHNSDTNNLRGRNVVILSNTSLTCSQVRVTRWCRMPPHWHEKQKWRRSYIVTTMARLRILSSSSRSVLHPAQHGYYQSKAFHLSFSIFVKNLSMETDLNSSSAGVLTNTFLSMDLGLQFTRRREHKQT